MNIFHELAFEGYLQTDGAAALYSSDPRLVEIMGAVDVLHVSGYTSQTSGTSPLLSIGLASTNDFTSWIFRAPVINALSLSTSGETIFQGIDGNPTDQRLGYTTLLFQLDGTSARTFLRVWVTGRDQSRRSAAAARAAALPPQRAGLARTTASFKPALQMQRNPYGGRG
jgi:hypothetical protein